MAECSEAAARVLPHPARKRPCCFAIVALGEMAGAQGKELEELAGEVFVGFLLLAGRSIEPDEHRRISDHRLEQRGEAAEGASTQRFILLVHKCNGLYLLDAGREMAVPEESQLLAELVGPVEDTMEPANLEQIG